MSWTEFRPFTDYIGINEFTGHPGRKGDWQTKLAPLDLEYFSQAEGCFPRGKGVFDYKREDNPKEPCEITCGIYFIRVNDKSAKGNKETPSGYYDYIGLSANFKKKDFQSGIFGRLSDHYRKLVCLPSRDNFGELIIKYQLEIDLSDIQKEREKEIKKHRPSAIQHLKDQNFKNYDELREYFGASSIDKDGPGLFGTTEYFHKAFKVLRKSNDLNSIEGINEFFKKNVRLAFYKHNFSGESNLAYEKGKPKIKNDGTNQINHNWQKFIEFISKGEGVALATYQKEYGKLPFLNKRDEIKGLDNLPKGF